MPITCYLWGVVTFYRSTCTKSWKCVIIRMYVWGIYFVVFPMFLLGLETVPTFCVFLSTSNYTKQNTNATLTSKYEVTMQISLQKHEWHGVHRHYKGNIVYSLGQLWVLHIACSILVPSHSVPPYAAAGLSQALVREKVPPPHNTEQSPYFDHPLHAPFTVNKTKQKHKICHTTNSVGMLVSSMVDRGFIVAQIKYYHIGIGSFYAAKAVLRNKNKD